MSGAHTRGVSNDDRKKHEASIKRTQEQLAGKLALLAEWEQSANVDPDELKRIRQKVTKLRAQLIIKNVPIYD